MRHVRGPLRFVLLAVALAGAAGAGYAGGVGAARSKPLRVEAYGAMRAPGVAHRSAQMEDGYVLLAGDSHAELARPGPTSCGRPFLNAGLSGARAGGYADFLAGLSLASRPAVAVVTLGTNHLLRKHNPSGPEAADRYEAELARVVEHLKGRTGRVIVAAIPPVPEAADPYVDVAGVANLTARQAAVCARLGCEALDPYASYREGRFARARPGTSRDGLHLDDYRPAYRAIDAALCR